MYAEFLDESHFYRDPPRNKVNLYKVQTYSVPTIVVDACANPQHLNSIRVEDADYIDELTLDIKKRGIRTPLDIWCDSEGFIFLKEGHHRLIAAKRLGIDRLPVRVILLDRKLAKGHRVVLLPAVLADRIEEWFALLDHL